MASAVPGTDALHAWAHPAADGERDVDFRRDSRAPGLAHCSHRLAVSQGVGSGERPSPGDTQLRRSIPLHLRARPSGVVAGSNAECVRSGEAAGNLRPGGRDAHAGAAQLPLHAADGPRVSLQSRSRHGGIRARPGVRTAGNSLARHAAAASTFDCIWRSACRPVHLERLWRGVADALPDLHMGHLPAVRVGIRPIRRRRAFAGAGRHGRRGARACAREPGP